MNVVNGYEAYGQAKLLQASDMKARTASSEVGFAQQIEPLESNMGCGEGCTGQVNQVDMEAFFAAWGTDNAEFDIDNSGVVDGADLSIFLGSNAGPMAGSVEDVHEQWGYEGVSSADLNGDLRVDGQDLTMALSREQGVESQAEEADPEMTKLEGLLADWGTNSAQHDLNNDGTVDGADLSMLLSMMSNPQNQETQRNEAAVASSGPVAINPAETLAALSSDGVDSPMESISKQVYAQLGRMGFEDAPPQNLQQLVNAFNFTPQDSKMMFSKILDLFGGKNGGVLAKG